MWFVRTDDVHEKDPAARLRLLPHRLFVADGHSDDTFRIAGELAMIGRVRDLTVPFAVRSDGINIGMVKRGYILVAA